MVLDSRRSTLGEDVATAMRHYEQMLRRHIVADSDIAELARRIYEKHRTALDLIYEHRPDLQSLIADRLHELIEAEGSLELDHCSKGYVRFCPRTWDGIQALRAGEGWTRSGRLLLFECKNQPQFFRMYLIIGPGPRETRERLFAHAQAHPEVFSKNLGTLNVKYKSIWWRHVLNKKDLQERTPDEIRERIEKTWSEFQSQVLPRIRDSIEQAGM